jgi:ATP-dependent DNA helicase PIF1
MSNIKALEKKWIENFKKSPLVDKSTGLFKSDYAHQLFYGKTDSLYPINFPHDFQRHYSTYNTIDQSVALEIFNTFLKFIGIEIRHENLKKHIEGNSLDYKKFVDKCYYIFKMLAHYDKNLTLTNPYKDNFGDILYLIRIESNDDQLTIFDEPLNLPDLYSRFKNFPVGYENDTVVTQLFNKIETGNDSIFITGKAGTGKSTFIQYFAHKTRKKVLMCAFTGIAAINVGGQTIHSFFRFPPKPLLPEDHEIVIFEKYSQKYKMIQEIDTIIIDEISMLRADILEAIDYSLRRNGGNPNKLFGGKQIIFVGDIFQLPPVTNTLDEVENILFTEVFKSKYSLIRMLIGS